MLIANIPLMWLKNNKPSHKTSPSHHFVVVKNGYTAPSHGIMAGLSKPRDGQDLDGHGAYRQVGFAGRLDAVDYEPWRTTHGELKWVSSPQ